MVYNGQLFFPKTFYLSLIAAILDDFDIDVTDISRLDTGAGGL